MCAYNEIHDTTHWFKLSIEHVLCRSICYIRNSHSHHHHFTLQMLDKANNNPKHIWKLGLTNQLTIHNNNKLNRLVYHTHIPMFSSKHNNSSRLVNTHSCFSPNTINGLQYKGKNNLFHVLFLNSFRRLTPFKIMSETRWDVTPFSSNKFMVLSDGVCKANTGFIQVLCRLPYQSNWCQLASPILNRWSK